MSCELASSERTLCAAVSRELANGERARAGRMSTRLEILGPDSWQEFLTAPRAVLVLGKSDCDACARWSDELSEWLTDPARWPDVRFGKLLLNTPGLVAFKRANPWVASLDMLPHTIV